LRMIKAWKSPMMRQSSSGDRPGLASMSRSACSRSRARPSGPSVSDRRTRWRMPPSSAARRQSLAEDLLGGADPTSQLDTRAEMRERELERRQRDHHVERADVPQVREADDLALELVLPTRER